MALQETLPKDPFYNSLIALLDYPCAQDSLASIRKQARDRFIGLGLPEKKNEAFRYLPFQSLYSERLARPSHAAFIDKESILPHVAEESLHSFFTCVNGELRLDLSDLSALPKQAIIYPLEKGFAAYKSYMQQRSDKWLREENDPFALLNAALQPQGCFVYVPPNTVIETPIQCLHLLTGEKGHVPFVNLRAHLFIGAHAEVQLCAKTVVLNETDVSENSLFFATAYWDAAVEEGAKFSYLPLFSGMRKGWGFDYFRATVKRSAQLKTVSCSLGGKSVRQSLHVSLIGENSEADLQGVWMLDGSRHSHTRVLIDHQVPHTRSMQCFKGVLNDVSQSSFEGKIYVRKEAQKTEAYQLNNNLLIGKNAIANSRPNLEIFADDVKASHGSTVAQLDPAQLFYLRARGIDTMQAKSLLVAGFCKTVLDQIPIASVRIEMEQHLQDYLTSGRNR